MQFTQKITPFLSFQSEAEQAANFYVSVLPDARILKVLKNPADGAVMTVEFELAGMTFVALNTGQDWPFTNAFSLSVACETQDEIDTLWEKLTADGGKAIQCGWLTDKFGLAWQIVPAKMGEWMGSSDPERAGRVFNEMIQMIKLDMHTLQAAYEGK